MDNGELVNIIAKGGSAGGLALLMWMYNDRDKKDKRHLEEFKQQQAVFSQELKEERRNFEERLDAQQKAFNKESKEQRDHFDKKIDSLHQIIREMLEGIRQSTDKADGHD